MIHFSGDKVEYTLASTALIIAVLLAVFDSIVWIFVVGCIYLATLLWGTHLLGLLNSQFGTLQYAYSLQDKSGESCGVCGGGACKRHQRSNNILNIKVPKDFDNALEHLLEELLQNYVHVWYAELSSDKTFMQQFRNAIASAARSIAERLFRCNTAEVIFNHLVPIAVQHAQDWQKLVNRAQSHGGKPTNYVTNVLGARIHPAAYSRDAELRYLRGLITTLMPHLLPATQIPTNNRIILREILTNWILLPAMDALADPDNLNTLIALSTHHEGTFSETTDAANVPLLYSWSLCHLQMDNVNFSLKPSLDEVLNNPQLLYLFMQHIKETGPVYLLQFYLDIDDLSKRVLNPDMTSESEENLYLAATNIYASYLASDSINYLGLPLHITNGLQSILEGGPSKIQELRTSRPLYEAHQEAHTLLELTCLPDFHHSYQLYTLLCGQQAMGTPQKCNNQNSVQGATVGMGSRLSNQIGRIQRVLRTSAVDGAPYQPQNVYQAEEVDCLSRLHIESHASEISGSRDLTTWRVTIPHVDSGGAQPLYMIAVHSVAEDKSWTALRRDVDFYSLRARLTEFHGDKELNDSPLPARKNQHTSLDTNRQRYQEFLQKLLSKPTLRNSELLHAFLTASSLEPYYPNYSTPDISLLYQNVAHKLRKERGQHLDNFMTTFLASVNTKHEYTDMGVEPSSECSINAVPRRGRDLVNVGPFGNNLNLSLDLQTFPFVSNPPQHVKGACFCIAEAVNSLLRVPSSLNRAHWVIASLLYEKLDPIVNNLLNETLVKLLDGGRAATVVKLLHDCILHSDTDEKPLDSTAKKKLNLKQARDGLHGLVPWWLLGIHSSWCRLMDSLLDPLQDASFNKHLAYTLVDQVVADLFPETLQ